MIDLMNDLTLKLVIML